MFISPVACPPCWLCQQPINLKEWALQPSPSPPDASRGVKTQQVTARNRNVHISTEEQGVGRPTTSQIHLPYSVGTESQAHLWGNVCRSCWIYELPIPSVMWPEWINQTPDRQQLVLLQIMFSPICAIFIDQVSGAANLRRMWSLFWYHISRSLDLPSLSGQSWWVNE